MYNKKISKENTNKENQSCFKEDGKRIVSRKESKPVRLTWADELNGNLIENIECNTTINSVSDTSDASDKKIKGIASNSQSAKQMILEE